MNLKPRKVLLNFVFESEVCLVDQIVQKVTPTMEYNIHLYKAYVSPRSIVRQLPIVEEPVTSVCLHERMPFQMTIPSLRLAQYDSAI